MLAKNLIDFDGFITNPYINRNAMADNHRTDGDASTDEDTHGDASVSTSQTQAQADADAPISTSQSDADTQVHLTGDADADGDISTSPAAVLRHFDKDVIETLRFGLRQIELHGDVIAPQRRIDDAFAALDSVDEYRADEESAHDDVDVAGEGEVVVPVDVAVAAAGTFNQKARDLSKAPFVDTDDERQRLEEHRDALYDALGYEHDDGVIYDTPDE